MLAKVRITMALLLLMLPILLFQGCGSTSNGVDSAATGATPNLVLTTLDGAATSTLIADGISSLQLQMRVTSQSGQPQAGTQVKFSTNAGSLSIVPGTDVVSTSARATPRVTRQTSSNFTSITVSTNANGLALVQLVSSATTSVATVTAEVDEFRQSIKVSFISGVPTSLTVSAAPAAIGINTQGTITAAVTDTQGDPVEGTEVQFTITPNNSGAALIADTAITDSNGAASVFYNAGPNAGLYTIKALVATTPPLVDMVEVTVQAETSSANTIDLLVSSPQMNSDNSKPVTLIALVRDANNNFVADQEVRFEASSGGIQITNAITDATGAATALLSTAGDPANRPIEVKAHAGSSSSTNTVEVSGTTLILNGTNTLALGGQITLSILLQDSGGNGIPNESVTVESTIQNNTLNDPNSTLDPSAPPTTAATVTTDFNGQATVLVTADSDGQDSIEAETLVRNGVPTVTTTFALAVSSADFRFITPVESDREIIPLGTSETVTIQWLQDGEPVRDKTVNFFATRGVLSPTPATVVTDLDGKASVQISSTTAGPAVITAEVDDADGPSSQISLEFIATNPTSLILQASPTSLSVNLSGASDQQSIITAVVRDVDHNLVKNQQVSFALTDNTGGSIFPASAITDSFGRASTVYTASASSSAQDGVLIQAAVVGTSGCNTADVLPNGPCDQVTLTVSQRSLFVTLGTSHLINDPTSTQYAKPYSVLVSDANSNPVAGAIVELNLYPTRYQKGFYTQFFDVAGNCSWGRIPTVNPGNGLNFADDGDRACENEDVNRNGIMDFTPSTSLPTEDINNNAVLDPGNIAAVPITVTTDDSGFALFDITYAREFIWTEVQIEARATVAGSEAFNTQTLTLPGLASDFSDCKISPPGQVSPFGLATTCSCDEETDPTCPTRSGLTPVSITPASTILTGITAVVITYNVTGGSEIGYFLASTGGALSKPAIGFGESFTLTVPASPNFTLIEVVATDSLTGTTGTAKVTIDPL